MRKKTARQRRIAFPETCPLIFSIVCSPKTPLLQLELGEASTKLKLSLTCNTRRAPSWIIMCQIKQTYKATASFNA